MNKSEVWKEDSVDTLFKVNEVIAEGGRGVIFRGVNKQTGETVAIKRLPKADTEKEGVEKETYFAKVMGDDDPVHFVRMYGIYEDDKFYYVVSDLAPGVELYEHMIERLSDESHPMTDKEIKEIMQQVCQTVARCHCKNIIHCDIKFENFMYTKDPDGKPRLLLLDFGEAKFKSKTGQLGPGEALTGTPAYMSPELISMGEYGEASDMWAVGVMLHVLLTQGELPFEETKILAGACCDFALEPETWETVDRAGSSLVENLFSKFPQVRPSANDCLESEFIGSTAVQPAPAVPKVRRRNTAEQSHALFNLARNNKAKVVRAPAAPSWLQPKFGESSIHFAAESEHIINSFKCFLAQY